MTSTSLSSSRYGSTTSAPFCCLSHAPERADLHPERLLIVAESVTEQACDLIGLFDTARGQRGILLPLKPAKTVPDSFAVAKEVNGR